MKYHIIDVFINSKLKPPYFTGSMLRGTFGYALKRVTCINPSYRFDGCFAKDNCLYYEFFEKQNSFHPFWFDVNLRNKQIRNISGLISKMVVTDKDQKSYRLVKLDEIIGVGKQTVMGLRKIKIEELI